MVKAGDVVLINFPRTDQSEGKLRPALILSETPGAYDDFLICMISSQTHQRIENFDEVVSTEDEDFEQSGLKGESLLRLSRLAVVETGVFEGKIGTIGPERLRRIRIRLSDWISP